MDKKKCFELLNRFKDLKVPVPFFFTETITCTLFLKSHFPRSDYRGGAGNFLN